MQIGQRLVDGLGATTLFVTNSGGPKLTSEQLWDQNVAEFMRQYQNLSAENLEKIIADETFPNEAIYAATACLIKERLNHTLGNRPISEL